MDSSEMTRVFELEMKSYERQYPFSCKKVPLYEAMDFAVKGKSGWNKLTIDDIGLVFDKRILICIYDCNQKIFRKFIGKVVLSNNSEYGVLKEGSGPFYNLTKNKFWWRYLPEDPELD